MGCGVGEDKVLTATCWGPAGVEVEMLREALLLETCQACVMSGWPPNCWGAHPCIASDS